MSHHINLVRIKAVANVLKDYQDVIAFVGGATVSLYADYPEQTDTRPTEDIDVAIEVATYSAYTELQAQLYRLGFAIDTEAKITCRYKYDGLTVDIIPIEERILGFKNRWYKAGFANIERYPVENGTDIPIFPATYFIASKIEAFYDRGNGDGRTSKDFEDIVFVLDNRKSIWNELKEADANVVSYLKEKLAKLLQQPHIQEWIAGHLDHATAGTRSKIIIDKMMDFVVH